MKSTTSAIALAACFAPLVFASPMHMLRHAEADVDVKYVTDTAVVTDYAHVTQYVTAGEPEPTTSVTVTAEASPAASSSAAPANNHKNANGDHHWSYSHEQQSSSAPAPPAPAPPAPTTTSTTAAAPTTPVFTAPAAPSTPSVAAPATSAAAATTQAPAANNPGTNTAGLTYTSAIAAPTPASIPQKGDETYNPWDGTLQAGSLQATNNWRSQFQAPSVVWNLTLEQQILTRNAPGQSTRCQFEHGGTDGGQNLAEGYDSPTAAIGVWASEYDPNVYPNGIYNGSANHFTQLIWKDTNSMGCAAIECDGQGGSAYGWFYICNYYPVGNMGGEYEANVMNKKSS